MLRHANAELRRTPSAEQNMGMPIGQMRRWSVDDVWALPDDGNRYEVVDGELLVTPSPRRAHQLVAGEFFHELRAWLKGPGRSVGVVFMAPVDVVLDPHTLVQPDVVVLPALDRAALLAEGPAPTPLLAIEVLSRGTGRHDRLTKRPRFQRSGIECWLVDIDAPCVEQWSRTAETPVVCIDQLTWAPEGATEPFHMALAPVWAEIGG
jgi:Uma2 family endonuclease